MPLLCSLQEQQQKPMPTTSFLHYHHKFRKSSVGSNWHAQVLKVDMKLWKSFLYRWRSEWAVWAFLFKISITLWKEKLGQCMCKCVIRRRTFFTVFNPPLCQEAIDRNTISHIDVFLVNNNRNPVQMFTKLSSLTKREHINSQQSSDIYITFHFFWWYTFWIQIITWEM